MEWDKGKAVLWLGGQLTKLYGAGEAIYIGDDTTDEDAFRSLDGNGLTILVSERSRPSSAGYRLNNPEEVGWFLDQLLCLLRHARPLPASGPDLGRLERATEGNPATLAEKKRRRGRKL